METEAMAAETRAQWDRFRVEVGRPALERVRAELEGEYGLEAMVSTQRDRDEVSLVARTTSHTDSKIVVDYAVRFSSQRGVFPLSRCYRGSTVTESEGSFRSGGVITATTQEDIASDFWDDLRRARLAQYRQRQQ